MPFVKQPKIFLTRSTNRTGIFRFSKISACSQDKGGRILYGPVSLSNHLKAKQFYENSYLEKTFQQCATRPTFTFEILIFPILAAFLCPPEPKIFNKRDFPKLNPRFPIFRNSGTFSG